MSSSHHPMKKFLEWYRAAIEAKEHEPTAMTLATVSTSGKPRARIVLFKGIANDSFTFFSNYQSPKALELESTPYGAIVFFWPKMERQIRVEGRISKLSHEASNKYWKTRSRLSQLGAWASRQSQPLTKKGDLIKRLARFELKFALKSVPRPAHWGGWGLDPNKYEFWAARSYRLHDREEYVLRKNHWERRLLYP